MPTSIERTDEAWNPVVGCTKVSRGCKHCYAETLARRFMGINNFSAGDKSIQHVFLKPERLDLPLRWKKPRRVFVNSMSDLFHEDVPDSFVFDVFCIIEKCPQHTFQILTKRPERMQELFTSFYQANRRTPDGSVVLLPNCWLGVSVEDQKTADARIPLLLQTPAAVRFVSYEPALGPVDFYEWVIDRHEDSMCAACRGAGCLECVDYDIHLDQVIVGGESGPGARPFYLAWARSTIAQCRASGVACFVKQLGSHPIFDPAEPGNPTLAPPTRLGDVRPAQVGTRRWTLKLRDRKGGDMSEWPPDLRVREMPE